MSLRRALHVVFLTSFVLSIGCSDDSEIIASCKMPRMDDGSSICNDVTRGNIEIQRNICSTVSMMGLGSTWSEDSLCDQSSALGSCKLNKGDIMWFYPSKKHETAADVEPDCPGTFVAPSQ